MDLDGCSITENLTEVMIVESANHPLNNGVMRVTVPLNPKSALVNDSVFRRQVGRLDACEELLQ